MLPVCSLTRPQICVSSSLPPPSMDSLFEKEENLTKLISLIDTPSGELFKLLIAANIITPQGELLRKCTLPSLSPSEQKLFIESLQSDHYTQNNSIYKIIEALCSSSHESFAIHAVSWVGSLMRQLLLFTFPEYLERFFESFDAKAFYDTHRELIEKVRQSIKFEAKDGDLRLYVTQKKFQRGALSRKEELRAFVEEVFLKIGIQPSIKTHIHSGINHLIVVLINCSSKPYEIIFCETLSRQSAFSKDSITLPFNSPTQEMQVQTMDGWMNQSLMDVLLCHLNIKDIKSMGGLGWFMLCSAQLKGETPLVPGSSQELYEIFSKSAKGKYNEECKTWLKKKEESSSLAHLFFLLNSYISAQNFSPTLQFESLLKEIPSTQMKSPLADLLLQNFLKKELPLELLVSYLEVLFLTAYLQNLSIDNASIKLTHHELTHPILSLTLHEERSYFLHFSLQIDKSLATLLKFSQEPSWNKYEEELLSLMDLISPLSAISQPLISQRKECALYLKYSLNLTQNLTPLLMARAPLLRVIGMKLHLLCCSSNATQKNDLFFRLLPSLLQVSQTQKNSDEIVSLVAKLMHNKETELKPYIKLALCSHAKNLAELTWLKFLIENKFVAKAAEISSFYLKNRDIRDYDYYLKFLIYVFDSKVSLKLLPSFGKQLLLIFEDLKRDIPKEHVEKIYTLALHLLEEDIPLACQIVEKGEAKDLLKRMPRFRAKFWFNALLLLLDKEHPLYVLELGREKLPSLLISPPSNLSKEIEQLMGSYKNKLLDKLLQKRELSNALALVENSQEESINRPQMLLEVIRKSLDADQYRDSYHIFLNLLKSLKNINDPKVTFIFEKIFVYFVKNNEFKLAEELFIRSRATLQFSESELTAFYLYFLNQQREQQIENTQNLHSIDLTLLKTFLTETDVRAWSPQERAKFLPFLSILLRKNSPSNDPALALCLNHFLPRFLSHCFVDSELEEPLSHLLFKEVIGNYTWIENSERTAAYFWHSLLKYGSSDSLILVRKAEKENLHNVVSQSLLIQETLLTLAEREESSLEVAYEFLQLFLALVKKGRVESPEKAFQSSITLHHRLVTESKFLEALELLLFLVKNSPSQRVEPYLASFFEVMSRAEHAPIMLKFLKEFPSYKSFEEIYDYLLLLTSEKKFEQIIEILALPQFENRDFALDKALVFIEEIITFYCYNDTLVIPWKPLISTLEKVVSALHLQSRPILTKLVWVDFIRLSFIMDSEEKLEERDPICTVPVCTVPVCTDPVCTDPAFTVSERTLTILQLAEKDPIFRKSYSYTNYWTAWLTYYNSTLSFDNCVYILSKVSLLKKIRKVNLNVYLGFLKTSFDYAKKEKMGALVPKIFNEPLNFLLDKLEVTLHVFILESLGEYLLSSDPLLKKYAYNSFQKILWKENELPVWDKLFTFSAHLISSYDIQILNHITLLSRLNFHWDKKEALLPQEKKTCISVLKSMQPIITKTLDPYLFASSLKLLNLSAKIDEKDINGLLFLDLIRSFIPLFDVHLSYNVLCDLFYWVKERGCTHSYKQDFFYKTTQLFVHWSTFNTEPEYFFDLNTLFWDLLIIPENLKYLLHYLSEMEKVFFPWSCMMCENFGSYLMAQVVCLPSKYQTLKNDYVRKSLIFLDNNKLFYSGKVRKQLEKSKKNPNEIEVIKIIEKLNQLFFKEPSLSKQERALETIYSSEAIFLKFDPRLLNYLYTFYLSRITESAKISEFFEKICKHATPAQQKSELYSKAEATLFDIYKNFMVLNSRKHDVPEFSDKKGCIVEILTITKIMTKRGIFRDKLENLFNTLRDLSTYIQEFTDFKEGVESLSEISPPSILLDVLTLYKKVLPGTIYHLINSLKFFITDTNEEVNQKELTAEEIFQRELGEYLTFYVLKYIKTSIQMGLFEEKVCIYKVLTALKPQIKVLFTSKNPKLQNIYDLAPTALLMDYKFKYKVLPPEAEAHLLEFGSLIHDRANS